MKWLNRYATDILIIDNDHRKLIELTDWIETLVTSGNPDSTEVEHALERLIDYTEYHFKREEGLMRKYRIAGQEAHTEEHREFTNSAKLYRSDWQANREADTLIKLATYLKEWSIDHITGSDQEMANQIRNSEGFTSETGGLEDQTNQITNKRQSAG